VDKLKTLESQLEGVRAENTELREQLDALRAENADLREGQVNRGRIQGVYKGVRVYH
jgi:cell division protein FtsB